MLLTPGPLCGRVAMTTFPIQIEAGAPTENNYNTSGLELSWKPSVTFQPSGHYFGKSQLHETGDMGTYYHQEALRKARMIERTEAARNKSLNGQVMI